MVVIIIQYKILQICLIIIYTENGSLLNMMWNTVSFSSVFKKHLLINIYSVLYPGRSVSLLQDSYLYFLMLTYEEELIITRNEDVLGTKIWNHWVFKTSMWRSLSFLLLQMNKFDSGKMSILSRVTLWKPFGGLAGTSARLLTLRGSLCFALPPFLTAQNLQVQRSVWYSGYRTGRFCWLTIHSSPLIVPKLKEKKEGGRGRRRKTLPLLTSNSQSEMEQTYVWAKR